MMRLDRTAFKMGSHHNSGDNSEYWAKQTSSDRLKAAFYLNSIAYNFNINNVPKIDRNAFKMRKQDE